MITFAATCGISPRKCPYGGVVRQAGRSGTRSTGPRRFARRLRRRAIRVARRRIAQRSRGRGRFGWIRLGTASGSPWLRRGTLAAVLVVLALVPYPSLGGSAIVPAAACRTTCHPGQQNMLKWTRSLPGSWNVLPGLSGTAPANGQAFAAVGNGLVALGTGMTVYAYSAANGKLLWQDPLTEFPAGAAIVSVRNWTGEVTVGVSYQGQRTEVVLAAPTGVQTGQYLSAPFGGAVAGTVKYTVIVGATAVTSYANGTGRVRWQRPTGKVAQSWQADGRYLYVAESQSGYLGSAPVTALRRIDTVTGAEQEILPAEPAGSPPDQDGTAFDGSLAAAFDGVVLFSSAAGVTAYSGSTGVRLWSMAGVVPEGADPQQGRFYLTRGSSLVAVIPLTGRIRATVPSGGLYSVRDGVALGLDLGASGDAWGYYLAGQRVAMTAPGLGWPHYFVDSSELGGSADPHSDLIVIAACTQAGQSATTQPTQSATPTSSASPSTSASADPTNSDNVTPSTSTSASTSPTPATPVTQPCLRPELVALGLLGSWTEERGEIQLITTRLASSSAELASVAWRRPQA